VAPVAALTGSASGGMIALGEPVVFANSRVGVPAKDLDDLVLGITELMS
jgi:hypothetical protein